MKKYEDLNSEEKQKIYNMLVVWLKPYTDKVIKKVVKNHIEDILNYDFAMYLLEELYNRTTAANIYFAENLDTLITDYDSFEEYDVHSCALEHPDSYRNVLYDLYIK